MSDSTLNNETLASHQFDCPHCEQPIPLDETKSGADSICPHCTQRIVIPADGYKAPTPSKVDRAVKRVWPTCFEGQTLSAFLGGQGVEPPKVDLENDETVLSAVQQESKEQREESGHVLETEHAQRYDVGDMVAKGGMGAILAAKDVNIRRGVAMKVMLRSTDVGSSEMLRFIEEAQVTGQLEHPNIVPVHELGIDVSGNVFYTMKFVRGITLKDILAKIRTGNGKYVEEFPLSRLLTIFLKICDAMAFAHSRGVIHRDLKPGNIMIGDYGEVLVLDWGLAKIIGREDTAALNYDDDVEDRPDWVKEDVESYRADEDTYKTMAGTIMGTPTFMSPEQALGEVNKTDARSDIYTLGGILYNILTLHTPIVGTSNVNELLMDLVAGKVTPPEYWNPDGDHLDDPSQETTLTHCPNQRVPSSLSAVAMKALARKQEDRYQTVKDLQADIEAYQTGFATEAEEANLLRQIWLMVMRHKREFALAAVAILVLVAVVSGFLISLKLSYDREKTARIAEQTQKEKVIGLNEDLKIAKLKTEQELYNSNIAFAKECLFAEPARPVLARKVLASCDPTYRHFEWTFLQAKVDRGGTPHAIGGWQTPSSWRGRMVLGASGELLVVVGDTQVARGCKVWWYRRDGQGWKTDSKAFPGIGSARSVAIDSSAKHVAVQGARATYIMRLAGKGVVRIVQDAELGLLDYLDMQSDRIGFQQGSSPSIKHFRISTLEEGDGIPKPVGEITPPKTRLTTRIATTRATQLALSGGKTLSAPAGSGRGLYTRLFASPARRSLVLCRGPAIAVYAGDTCERLWQKRLSGGDEAVARDLSVSPDGRYLVIVTGGRRKGTLLLNGKDGSEITSFQFAAASHCFSNDGKKLALADGNKLFLADAASGDIEAIAVGHDSAILQMRFLSGDRGLVSVSAEQILTTRTAWIRKRAVTQDAIVDFLGQALSEDKGHVRVRQPFDGEVVSAASERLSVLSDGRLLCLRESGRIGVGRPGQILQYTSSQKAWPEDAIPVGAALSRSGKHALIWGHKRSRRSALVVSLCEPDKWKKLWDLDAVGVLGSHRMAMLMNENDQIWSAAEKKVYEVAADPAYSGQSHWFLAGLGSMYEGGRRVEYKAGEYVVTFAGGDQLSVPSGTRTHTGRLVSTVAFSGDGRRATFVVGGVGAHVYDLQSKAKLVELTGGQAEVAALCMSADGMRVVVWGTDGSLRFWNAEKGTELLAFDVPKPVGQSCDLQFIAGGTGIRGESNDLQGKALTFAMIGQTKSD